MCKWLYFWALLSALVELCWRNNSCGTWTVQYLKTEQEIIFSRDPLLLFFKLSLSVCRAHLARPVVKEWYGVDSKYLMPLNFMIISNLSLVKTAPLSKTSGNILSFSMVIIGNVVEVTTATSSYLEWASTTTSSNVCSIFPSIGPA